MSMSKSTGWELERLTVYAYLSLSKFAELEYGAVSYQDRRVDLGVVIDIHVSYLCMRGKQ
jgi:hypothetical protein